MKQRFIRLTGRLLVTHSIHEHETGYPHENRHCQIPRPGRRPPVAQIKPQWQQQQCYSYFTKIPPEDRRSELSLVTLHGFQQQGGIDRDTRLRRMRLPCLLQFVRFHGVSRSSVHSKLFSPDLTSRRRCSLRCLTLRPSPDNSVRPSTAAPTPHRFSATGELPCKAAQRYLDAELARH